MSVGNFVYADCSTLGKRNLPYDASTRSIEYFESVFKIDLSEIGTINDYPGRDGFYSAIAKKVGLVDKVKTHVSKNWPNVKPAGMIRYSDECWIFFLFKFNKQTKEFSWKRTLLVSHSGEIKDMGSVEPGAYNNPNQADHSKLRFEFPRWRSVSAYLGRYA